MTSVLVVTATETHAVTTSSVLYKMCLPLHCSMESQFPPCLRHDF